MSDTAWAWRANCRESMSSGASGEKGMRMRIDRMTKMAATYSRALSVGVTCSAAFRMSCQNPSNLGLCRGNLKPT